MGTLWQDFRYGFRMLAKSPGFTAVAVLTLALGIGANTAIFGLVDAFFLRPLPGITQPEKIARMEATSNGSGMAFSYVAYKYYEGRNRVLEGLAAFRDAEFQLGGGGQPQRIEGTSVSSDYFAVLGVRLALGRWFFQDEDETPDGHAVAVISYELWKSRFRADRSLVGKTVILNGRPFTVIGIAAKGFRGIRAGEPCDIWVPLAMYHEAMPDVVASFDDPQIRWLNLIGRLRPGVSARQAQSEMSGLSQQLQLAYPGVYRGERVGVSSAFGLRFDGYEEILFAVVVLLLLIACSNVANLTLAQSSKRQAEFALRHALGASRGRLARQLLVEGTLLAILGGSAAVLVALWAERLLLPFLNSGGSPLMLDLRPDVRVFGFTFAVSVLSGIAFTLVPIFKTAREKIVLALNGSSAGRSFRSARLQSFLVVVQISLSLVLLSGAALLLRTLTNIDAVKPNFQTENVLLATVQPGMQGYDRARLNEFYRQLQQQVENLPGVQATSLATEVLAGNVFTANCAAEGHEPSQWTSINYDAISPGYFHTLRIPLISGREFDWGDSVSAPKVVVLNESASRELYGSENPVGKLVRFHGEREPREVAGVVEDVRDRRLWKNSPAEVYFPLLQEHPWPQSAVTIHIRTTGYPMSETAAVKRVVQGLDTNLPVYDVRTMRMYLQESLWDVRSANAVMGTAGVLALLLAMVGIYGVTSYGVTHRTREIGVRMALGAQPGNVLRMVIGEGMVLAGIGIAAGIAGALVLTRFLQSLLFEIKPTDPATFAGVAILLAVVALLACYIPARRAMRVDPMVALRYE